MGLIIMIIWCQNYKYCCVPRRMRWTYAPSWAWTWNERCWWLWPRSPVILMTLQNNRRFSTSTKTTLYRWVPVPVSVSCVGVLWPVKFTLAVPLRPQIMYCSLSRTKYQDHACSLEKEHVCLTLSVSVLHVSCWYVPLYLWTCPTSSLDLSYFITELLSSSLDVSHLITKHFPPHHWTFPPHLWTYSMSLDLSPHHLRTYSMLSLDLSQLVTGFVPPPHWTWPIRVSGLDPPHHCSCPISSVSGLVPPHHWTCPTCPTSWLDLSHLMTTCPTFSLDLTHLNLWTCPASSLDFVLTSARK